MNSDRIKSKEIHESSLTQPDLGFIVPARMLCTAMLAGTIAISAASWARVIEIRTIPADAFVPRASTSSPPDVVPRKPNICARRRSNGLSSLCAASEMSPTRASIPNPELAIGNSNATLKLASRNAGK
jgi:hypothetical protein